jgi:hypothetical protein
MEETSDILWIEYGDDPGEARGVPAFKYIDYLSDSDFTLYPPGYSPLTHRVIEALVRGSIPVLHEQELELYDIHFQNRVNCVAVKNGDWLTAIKEIQAISQDVVIEMRSNILAMKDTYLSNERYLFV